MLPNVLSAINHSVCRVTGLRPVEIDENNSQEVREKVYGEYIRARREPNFEVGDKVRVALFKKVFDRGFYPNFTDHIYTIHEVIKRNPNYYRLKEVDGKILKGRFYPEQLQKVIQDEATTYRIEKIIRKKKVGAKTRYLVKFIGYPEEEWIDATDIV